jgi:hypothetical protein
MFYLNVIYCMPLCFITIVNKDESVKHNPYIVLKSMPVVTTCFGPSRGHYQAIRMGSHSVLAFHMF